MMLAASTMLRRFPGLSMSRQQKVWASLVAAMTGVGGLLMVLESPRIPRGGPLLPLVQVAPGVAPASLDQLFSTTPGIERGRWTGIVIHHSGAAVGSAQSLTQEHSARGFRGLGYHFVISNGQGAPDGQIVVGYRWQEQLPGVHVTGPQAEPFNRQTLGICLVGDGERRPFTAAQLRRLAELVDALQRELGIPDSKVFLHRDVSPSSSPGRLFPEAAFRQMLADGR